MSLILQFSVAIQNVAVLTISDCLTHSRQCDFCNLLSRLLMFLGNLYCKQWGAQWLSGRVLDSRPKGRGFEPQRRHCVVVLEQDTFILA